MKKLLLLLVVIALLVVGVGPYLMGGRAEHYVRQYWQAIDDSTVVRLNFSEYKRGWLKSTATITVTVDMQEENLSPFDLTSTLEIVHGPILRTEDGIKFGHAFVTSELHMAESMRAMVKPFIGDQPLFRSTSLIGFNDRVKSEFASAKPSFSQPALNIDVRWEGFYGSTNSNLAITEMDLDMVFGAITGKLSTPSAIPNANGQTGSNTLYELNSQPMKMLVQAKQQMPGVMSGETSLHWPGMKLVSAKPEENVEIKNFKFTMRDAVDNNRMNYEFDLAIGEINAAKEYQLSKLAFQFAVKNINVKALSDLITKLGDISKQQDITAAMDNLSADDATFLEKVGLDLFMYGVEFNLNRFTVTVGEDDMEMMSQLQLPAVDSQKEISMELLNQLYAKLYLKLPVEWPNDLIVQVLKQQLRSQQLAQQSMANVMLRMQQNPSGAKLENAGGHLLSKSDAELKMLAAEQVDEVVKKAISMGLIKQNGAHYVLDYEYKQGKVVVNGKPTEVFSLLGQFMQLQQAAMPTLPAADDATAVETGDAEAMDSSNELESSPAELTNSPDAAEFLKNQEEIMKKLEQQQQQQMEELNKQLDKMKLLEQ